MGDKSRNTGILDSSGTGTGDSPGISLSGPSFPHSSSANGQGKFWGPRQASTPQSLLQTWECDPDLCLDATWPNSPISEEAEGPHLQGENDDGEAHGSRDAHGHDDGIRVVETGNHAHHVGETQRQDGL